MICSKIWPWEECRQAFLRVENYKEYPANCPQKFALSMAHDHGVRPEMANYRDSEMQTQTNPGRDQTYVACMRIAVSVVLAGGVYLSHRCLYAAPVRHIRTRATYKHRCDLEAKLP